MGNYIEACCTADTRLQDHFVNRTFSHPINHSYILVGLLEQPLRVDLDHPMKII